MNDTPNLDWLVSVDDHILEPPHSGDHANTDADLDTLDVRQTFRDHVYGCFIHDEHGVASIDEIGEDNMMCETDYPHSDSTWPDCIHTARAQVAHLAPDVQYKVLHGNAEQLYRFTPAEPPARVR